MSFLAPAAFLFAAAIPVVIVFYLLKRKRALHLVSSTVLWQRFLAETQASAPFQRLRKNWLLLLQLLLLALLVFALARPFFSSTAKPAELRVLIMDGSASMKATDESPTRFEKARSDALKWVDGLRGADQMVVILAGHDTEVRQSATADKAALRRALLGCAASDTPTRLAPALRVAESLVRDRSGAEIHLFSDGAAAGLEEFENKGLPLIYHQTGRSGENLAITALDLRASPENPLERAIYANVSNFGTNRQGVTVQLLDGERPMESRVLDVPAGGSQPVVFTATHESNKLFTVRLAESDILAADNQASIASILPRPARVLLVTAGNRFLEKAIRAIPHLQVALAPALAGSAEEYDIVVLDNVLPIAWPRGNVLAIQVAQTNWFSQVQNLNSPAIADWRSDHPLLRFAGFDNVQIRQSQAVRTPDWAVSLLDAPQASLALAGELASRRIVWIGFDLLDSNWPLRVSFPIFIANAIEWLSPAGKREKLMAKTGEPVHLPVAQSQSARRVQIRTPSGREQALELPLGASELVYGDSREQGIYRVQIGTDIVQFGANLLDAGESRVEPQRELKFGQHARIAASGRQSENHELWRAFAALGLFVLMFEWWFYHRRSL